MDNKVNQFCSDSSTFLNESWNNLFFNCLPLCVYKKMTNNLIHLLFDVSFFVALSITSFLELFFGIPSLIFIMLPFITTSLLASNIKLMCATIVLALIACFSIFGLIAFVTKVILNSQDYRYQPKTTTFKWTQAINYFSINTFTLFLLMLWHIYIYTTSEDLFLPVLENIYRSEMLNFQDFNPNCPQFSPNRSRSSSEIFLDELHQRYFCCGWTGAKDWISVLDSNSERKLPFSCCPSLKILKNIFECRQDDPCNLDQDFYFKNNCQESLRITFRKFDPSNYSIGLIYFFFKLFAYLNYACSFHRHLDLTYTSKVWLCLEYQL